MRTIQPSLDGKDLHIGIVRARFNEKIGLDELDACVARLKELGVADEHITVVSVPGSLEVPLTLERLANTYDYDALIALGAVIRGQTYHFEVVSNEMAAGITRVQLDTTLPIANGVLTAESDDQAQARAARKGRECAETAVEMARLLAAIDGLPRRAHHD
jgi:6,7-dimethyl-8-ribityllumazine synthase